MERRYYILKSWWPVYIKKMDEYVCLLEKHTVDLSCEIVREVNSSEAIKYLKADQHAKASGSRASMMIDKLIMDEKEKFYKEVLNE